MRGVIRRIDPDIVVGVGGFASEPTLKMASRMGYKTLLQELKLYNPELLSKQRVLAVTKCDIIDADIEKDLAKSLPKRIPHVFISSASGEGLDKLKDLLWKALQQ